MGYRIEYGTSGSEKRSLAVKRYPMLYMTVLFFIGFLLLTVAFWPEGRNTMLRIILPGDSEVTAAALRGVVADLQAGADFSEVVTAFCREILAGAA